MAALRLQSFWRSYHTHMLFKETMRRIFVTLEKGVNLVKNAATPKR